MAQLVSSVATASSVIMIIAARARHRPQQCKLQSSESYRYDRYDCTGTISIHVESLHAAVQLFFKKNEGLAVARWWWMSPATAGSCPRSHCARESRAILQTSEEVQEGYGHLAMVFI